MKQINGTITDQGTTTYFTMILLRDECKLMLDDSVFHASIGDLVLAREKLSFKISVPSIVFYFKKSFFDNLFDSQISDCRIFYDFLHAPNADKEHLYFSNIGDNASKILDLFIDEHNKDDFYHGKIMRLLLVGLFSYLDRNHDETLIVPRSTMLQNHAFGKIMKYIGDNYRDVTLEKTAEEFGYNPDYLSYRFKKITGISFTKKILSIRMEEAMHLLLSTEMTIQEIAEANGYRDRSHFSRNFKEYTGLSPKQYRNTYR